MCGFSCHGFCYINSHHAPISQVVCSEYKVSRSWSPCSDLAYGVITHVPFRISLYQLQDICAEFKVSRSWSLVTPPIPCSNAQNNYVDCSCCGFHCISFCMTKYLDHDPPWPRLWSCNPCPISDFIISTFRLSCGKYKVCRSSGPTHSVEFVTHQFGCWPMCTYLWVLSSSQC